MNKQNNKTSFHNVTDSDVSNSKTPDIMVRLEEATSTPLSQRRRSLKKMALGSTVLGSAFLETPWQQPIINGVISPAHAQASPNCIGVTPPTGSQTFNTPGEFQFIVPDCVTQVSVEMSGAGGGNEAGGGTGGIGGFSSGNLSVSSGEVLTIFVGEKGGDRDISLREPVFGGFGFGRGGDSLGTESGAGGGGGSAVLQNGTPIIVAGGGGGAASSIAAPFDNGGNGGGPAGEPLTADDTGAPGGANGIGGIAQQGLPGGFIAGENGGDVTSGGNGGSGGNRAFSGGGGGGGYGGGASGIDAPGFNTPGGGGGGLAGPGGTTVTGGGSAGDGSVTISW